MFRVACSPPRVRVNGEGEETADRPPAWQTADQGPVSSARACERRDGSGRRGRASVTRWGGSDDRVVPVTRSDEEPDQPTKISVTQSRPPDLSRPMPTLSNFRARMLLRWLLLRMKALWIDRTLR
jgi:hypothetical protein